MRGSLLILLLILSVSGQQQVEDAAGEEGGETDSSDEANLSGTGEGTTSEEEVCSDCEETGNTIEEEEGVSNNATELKVLESATYLMASVGSTSISVRLDRVEGQENLQMVCQ